MFTRSFAGESVARHQAVRGSLLVGVAFMACMAVPGRASAVTIDEVVAMAKAGVSERVILAVIERDNSIFTIDPDQVVALQRQGLTEPVVLAMLRSGRPAGDEAAQREAEARATEVYHSAPVAPEIAIVGHGPDIPNTTRAGYQFIPGIDYPAPPFGYGYPYPPIIPFPPPYYDAPSSGARRHSERRDRAMCLAQTTGTGKPGGPMLSWVTECPPPLQLPARQSIK